MTQSELRSSPTFTHSCIRRSRTVPGRIPASPQTQLSPPRHLPISTRRFQTLLLLDSYSIVLSGGKPPQHAGRFPATFSPRVKNEPASRWRVGGGVDVISVHVDHVYLGNSNFRRFFLSQRNHIDSARRVRSMRVRGDKDCEEECLAGLRTWVSCVDIRVSDPPHRIYSIF
jgi:hypothetical protein